MKLILNFFRSVIFYCQLLGVLVMLSSSYNQFCKKHNQKKEHDTEITRVQSSEVKYYIFFFLEIIKNSIRFYLLFIYLLLKIFFRKLLFKYHKLYVIKNLKNSKGNILKKIWNSLISVYHRRWRLAQRVTGSILHHRLYLL